MVGKVQKVIYAISKITIMKNNWNLDNWNLI